MTDSLVVDVTQDWLVACDLQERFMEAPSGSTSRLAYSARCRQMRALGGDGFFILPLPACRIAIAVADASGKGLPAALIMANVQASLRTATLFAPGDPAAVVTAVNRQLYACSPADRHATLFYAVFEEDTRTLNYVNAGQNPAMILRPPKACTWLESVAPPIGFFADTIYQTHTVRLQPADLLVACTDGFIEAVNSAGQEWGNDGLLAAIAGAGSRRPTQLVQAAFAALDEFSGGRQADDATLLAALVH
jgi:sigma-B regulation protein RsbU (phosphoserine phosphatase)